MDRMPELEDDSDPVIPTYETYDIPRVPADPMDWVFDIDFDDEDIVVPVTPSPPPTPGPVVPPPGAFEQPAPVLLPPTHEVPVIPSPPSASGPMVPPPGAFEKPAPILLPPSQDVQYDPRAHTNRYIISHDPLVAAGEALEEYRTSSADLWDSLDGPTLLRRTTIAVATGFDWVTALVMLVGDLRSRPTKLGSTPMTVDQFYLDQVCQTVISLRYMDHISRPMERRLSSRLSRMYPSYTSVNPFPLKYADHPLANLAYACPVDSVALKWIMLNHAIGRYIIEKQPMFHGFGGHRLDQGSDFDIHEMLTSIGDLYPLVFLRGVEIQYTNEAATGEGVTRDWYGKVVDRMVNPENGLFEIGPDGVYRVNTTNGNMETHRGFYQAVGRVLALSPIEALPLGVSFNLGFYQVLLGKTDGWTELDLYKDSGMGVYSSWLQTANCGSDNSCDALMVPMVSLDLKRELVVGGASIDIDPSNCREWGRLAVDDHMYGKTRVAYEAIYEGMRDLLGDDILRERLHAEDLREILTGNLDIEIDALFAVMRFINGLTENSRIVRWLREILEENDSRYRSKFLFFVTGMKALPHGGFTGEFRNIQIYTSPENPDHLPTAHTCFLQLELPNYVSKEQLREKLTLAINNPDMTMY
jgi:hypothetical protein